ncbi:TerC family protein [Zavarzinia sp.]|uniref:TerC family protein n=1 Tax=Zavarzinia sp. TaxID=2027920 RepID=UPI003567B769
MATSPWVWAAFVAFVLGLIALDLGVLHRKAKAVSIAQAAWSSAAYIALAMVFAAGVFHFRSAEDGWAFVTGFLIEKSLSIDNIFVFVLIFGHFAVPAELQHRVLLWGVLGALAMRAVLIFAGVGLIAEFHWLVYLFGGFLIVTGIKMLLAADAEPDLANNRIIGFLRRRLRVTETYEGERFFLRRNGVLFATPLFLALVVIEASDLVFAVDSIPAILAVSQDPFIVFTANVFAILGLRALYFVLAGVIHRFHYLKYALALILVLVGVKMLVNGYFGGKTIPTEYALIATAALVFGSIALSWFRKAEAPAALPTGWVVGSPAKGEEAEHGR